VQRAPAAKRGAPDRVLAFRYDAGANALFPSPVDLGEADPAGGAARIALSRPREGVVRASIGRGIDVEVGSNGEIVRTGAKR
jgi:hypothetical protein